MDVSLVLEALDIAIKNSGDIDGVILHSDRGSQYCARGVPGKVTSPWYCL